MFLLRNNTTSSVAIGKARAVCAQSFALWQQATIELTCHDHSIIACSRHLYILLFFAHIPCVVNHTINTTPTERLQQHPLLFTTNRTNRTFFVWRLNPTRPSQSWSQHHFVDVSRSVTHKHELWIWFTLSYAMMKTLLRPHDCLRHEADRGFERWHCTIYCLECCTGFNDAKRQHLSPLTQTATCPLPRYRSKHIAENSQWVSPTTNSLTALLAKGERVRLREVVNTCTERRTEKCIQRTAWILSHVLHTTQCERFVPRRMTQWAVYYNALVPVRTYLSI